MKRLFCILMVLITMMGPIAVTAAIAGNNGIHVATAADMVEETMVATNNATTAAITNAATGIPVKPRTSDDAHPNTSGISAPEQWYKTTWWIAIRNFLIAITILAVCFALSNRKNK